MEHLSGSDRLKAVAALVAAVTFFASAFVAIRAILAANAFTTAELVMGRLVVASVLLGVLAAMRRGVRVPDGRGWLAFVALGTMGPALYQVLLTAGERTVDAGTAALLVSCAPIVASVLAVAFLGERLTWQGWAGTAIAFVGASVVASAAGVSLAASTGALMVVAATLLWACYQVVQKAIAHEYGAFELTAWPVWIATVVMAPFSLGLPRAVVAAPLSANLGVAWLGAASAVAGFLAWSYAIRLLPVVVSSNALFAVPVVAFVIGWIVLGETPAPLALGGGAIAVMGVLLMQARGRVAASVAGSATAPAEG